MIAIESPLDVEMVLGAFAFAVGAIIVAIIAGNQISKIAQRKNKKRKK